jgi:hypothetical protein
LNLTASLGIPEYPGIFLKIPRPSPSPIWGCWFPTGKNTYQQPF